MGPSAGQKGGDRVGKGRGDWLQTSHDPQGPRGHGLPDSSPSK